MGDFQTLCALSSTRTNRDSGNKHFEFKEKFIIKVSLDILMQKLHLPFSNSTEFPSRAFLQPEQNCINYSLLHMYLYFVMHFQCPHGVGALPFGRQLVPHHPAKMQKSNHPSNSTGYVSLFLPKLRFLLFRVTRIFRNVSLIPIILQLALFRSSSFTSVGVFYRKKLKTLRSVGLRPPSLRFR